MITLLATVLNEGDNIAAWLESFIRQTRQPDEIIIVDGGSHDNTVAIIERYQDRLPLRVIVQPGCNISQGRNVAMAAAQGDILAITDAGTRLTQDWLQKITQPLLDDAAVDVAAGFFVADPHSVLEAAMGATVLPLAAEIDPATFLPSSRSLALRRAAAQRIAGYPEWLDYCEDLVFDMRLKKSQATFVFVPEAQVYFRPRSSFGSFFKQYYRYARGDGKADLWRKRHAIRYLTYLAVAPLILLLGRIQPLFWLLYLIGGAVYLYRPYRRLPHVMRTLPKHSLWAWLYAIALVPIIRVLGDVAKMLGYPAGWRWRLQHQPPDWKQVRTKNL